MSATGFAMSENILYLGGYGYAAGADKAGVAGGLTGVIAVFIGRIPLSGFAHPLFTSMTAVGVGFAIRSTRRRVRVLAPIAGLVAAMHPARLVEPDGDARATTPDSPEILLYGYFSVMMPIFFGMVGTRHVAALRRGSADPDALWCRTYGPAGSARPRSPRWPPIGRRRSARAWAQRVAGPAGADAMRGFQLAATRLALVTGSSRTACRGRQRHVVGRSCRRGHLLLLMSAYRSGYATADPMAPQAFWDGSRYHVRFPDGVTRTVDAPVEPVVPIPVVAPPPPMFAYPGGPGYPGSYPARGYPPPGQPPRAYP